MRFIRSPKWVRLFFYSALWKEKQDAKTLFLTFDDGPTPRTKEILNLLEAYRAKATFFCVGANVEKYAAEFQEIIDAGHDVGNHSFSHPHGWKVSKKHYLDDVEKAQKLVKSRLFRPPYGKMTWLQYRSLRKKYRIVMWSHLSYDFDPSMNLEDFLHQLQRDFKGGEIVVLHDNLKYFDRSMEALKAILSWSREQGVVCSALLSN